MVRDNMATACNQHEAKTVVSPDPWLHHMRRGEWEQAWAICDAELPKRAVTPCTHWPRHLQHIWTGQPFAGKRVLVRCYHGLGDTIQFIRYMPQLRAMASRVIVWAQPKLLPLLRDIDGIDCLLPLHDGRPEADYDVDVEIMELAHVFRSTPETLPRAVPYLHATPMPLPGHLPHPRIGVVWQGGDWNPARAIPFDLLTPLFRAARGQLLVLQPGAHAAGWDRRSGTYLGEFGIPDYARALKALDLLITIDSMPAHLAGALGVPAWTLLHHDPDWRWMQGREDSPWYPRMRLFRQRRAGDWPAVIADVAAELSRRAPTCPEAGFGTGGSGLKPLPQGGLDLSGEFIPPDEFIP